MAFVPAVRPWVGDECRLVIAGCNRTPRPSGYCDHHERALFGRYGMTVKAGTHVRSLRMPAEMAAAVTAAARRLGLPENQFIVQACRYVCREAGIEVAEPEDAEQLAEDPFL